MSRVASSSLSLAAVAGAAALVLAGAAASGAAAQETTIVFGGPAAKALTAAGVTVTAARPAVAHRTRVSLPPSTVSVTGSGRAATALVAHGGSIRLAAGRRSVVLSELRVSVGARSSLSAVVGGTRRTVATIAAGPNRRSVDATGTYVTESPLTLTASAVRLLRTTLRRPALRGGRLGTIDLQATVTAPAAPVDTTDLPGAPAAPTITGPPTPGGAAVAARPAGAVAITGGTVSWSPRASWLGYLQGGGSGAGASGAAGATFDGTTYTLRISGGWYDAASASAVVTTTGTTRFLYPAHGIDMAFADWTYDLAGTAPKAVATVVAATGGGTAIGTKQPVALIKRGGTTPTLAPDGHTLTWTPIPLTLSAEGVPLYRAYLYDSDQGSISVAATVG